MFVLRYLKGPSYTEILSRMAMVKCVTGPKNDCNELGRWLLRLGAGSIVSESGLCLATFRRQLAWWQRSPGPGAGQPAAWSLLGSLLGGLLGGRLIENLTPVSSRIH